MLSLSQVFFVENSVLLIDRIRPLDHTREVILDGDIRMMVATRHLAGTPILEPTDPRFPLLKRMNHATPPVLIHPTITAVFAQTISIRIVNRTQKRDWRRRLTRRR